MSFPSPRHSLTSECRVRKMKRPESHAPLMIGRSISTFASSRNSGRARDDSVVNSYPDIRLDTTTRPDLATLRYRCSKSERSAVVWIVCRFFLAFDQIPHWEETRKCVAEIS
jgi:hypothetical protein